MTTKALSHWLCTPTTATVEQHNTLQQQNNSNSTQRGKATSRPQNLNNNGHSDTIMLHT